MAEPMSKTVDDRGHLGGDSVIVGVVEPVPLAVLVRRVDDGLQVAVREVRQIGHGGVAVGQLGAHLSDGPVCTVHRGFPVTHHGAAAEHVDRGRVVIIIIDQPSGERAQSRQEASTL
jgi:hypothetical protein